MSDSIVLEEIGAAFSGTELPASTVLMNEHCEECIYVSRKFCDAEGSFMTWESAAQREGSSFAPSLLTSDAWRYYLPTLMTWCVRDTEKVDVLVDCLVYELTPPESDDREWFSARTNDFTVDQRRAICSFLQSHHNQELAEMRSVGIEMPCQASIAIDYWTAPGQ
jgi:hypothetical protein